MNYGQVGLDLQAFVKREYFSILYESTFYKFLNENYIFLGYIDVVRIPQPRIATE